MTIVNIILPLILVALLGLFCAKSQWLSRIQIDAISKFTFYITIPAFLFHQMIQADFSQQISLKLFAAFYLPVLTCYGLAWLANQFLTRRERSISSLSTSINISSTKSEYKNLISKNEQHSESALFALGASYSNTVIIGLPILLLAIGESVISTVFLIVTFHSALLFLLTSSINAKANGQSFNWQQFIVNNIKNPLILSILLGAIFNLLSTQFSFELPKAINDTLQLLGKPAITLALFVLGASLAFYSINGKLKYLYIATIAKLIILPAFVWLAACYIFNLSEFTTIVLVILSSCPTGVNAYLVAKAQGKQQEVVAGTVVMTTLFSVITIPLWLALLL
jgi:predicted permease